MKSLFRLFVLILLLGGWGLAALSVHVIRTPAEIPITIITKNQLDLRDTYVDTTRWTIEDVSKHPVLIERILRTGRSDVLKHVVDPDHDIEQELTDALERSDDGEAKPENRSASREQLARKMFRWPWEQR